MSFSILKNYSYLLIFFIFTSYVACDNSNSTELLCPSPYNGKMPSFFLDNTDKNYLNDDNSIFISKRKFIYKYNAKNKDGQILNYFYKPPNKWKVIPQDSISYFKNECLYKVDYIELTVFESKGHTSLSNSQTIIRYDYVNRYKGIFNYSSETTGIIEDSTAIFLHPPRSLGFIITELNPFPRITFPLYIKKNWYGSISIPKDFVIEIIPNYKGETLSFDTEYKVIDTFTSYNTPYAKNINGYKIKAINKGELEMNSSAYFYFNEDYGFIKIDYVNYDSSFLSLELINVIDNDIVIE